MIRNVDGAEILIGDSRYRGPLALTAEEILDDWAAVPIDELIPAHLERLLQTQPEVIVLGTGATHRFAPREITFSLARQGVGLEVMDTAAAARTFNVLAGEGRRVAALLYV